MIETGRVLAVSAYPLGDELAEDTPAGAMTLTVTDPVDFEESGGYLRYAEVEVLQYVSVDDETGVITLAAPTTVAGYEGDVVEVWDPSANAVAHEFVAHVALEGEDQDSDAMEATIPHSLIPYLEEGIRAEETEFVSLEWQGESLYVKDVLHRDPVIGSSYVPEPVVDANKVYRGETPPWPDGDSTHADDDGDLWWQTATVTHEDGTQTQTFTPFLWDGTSLLWVDASDPEVDLVSNQIAENDEALAGLTSEVENVAETATDARNLASTADGRVSFSDYDPAPEDVTYYATDDEGNLILDSNGEPILLTRNPGSVWYTRTRARRNHCTNPSFEIDLSGWTVLGGTGERFDPADPTTPIDGTFALRITNDLTTDGAAEWAGGTPGLEVLPGQSYSASVFALLETGSGLGAYASVRFYDAGGVFLNEVLGEPVDLLTGDWQEIEVNATVPDTGALMVTSFHNPNASDVWLIDGALVEQAEYTGRYFDGDSYDASWSGDPHASTSLLEGGKIVSVYELYDSGWVRLDFTGSTQYDSDASDLTKGYLHPDRIEDGSLGVEKMKTNEVRASEALAKGDLVHVWNNNGLFFVRQADAANNFEAHGFVLQDAVAGDSVRVYTDGYNPYCDDLEPGPQFLSTSPGESSSRPPSGSGKTIQRVGFASDATTLHFTASQPIRLT